MISLMGHEERKGKRSHLLPQYSDLCESREKKCHSLKLLTVAAFRRPQRHQSLAQQSGDISGCDMRLAALYQLTTLVALDWKALWLGPVFPGLHKFRIPSHILVLSLLWCANFMSQSWVSVLF